MLEMATYSNAHIRGYSSGKWSAIRVKPGRIEEFSAPSSTLHHADHTTFSPLTMMAINNSKTPQ